MTKGTSVEVVQLRPEHWKAVRSIYAEGIETGDATFETEVPDWDEWDDKHLSFARLVARQNGEVVGWAALVAVSKRRVYEGVAEVSIYVGREQRGKGVGTRLLARLVDESEAHGIWTLQAGIFPENVVSVQMHEKCGFRSVGLRARLGKLAGRWRDVLLLERRSDAVGMSGPDSGLASDS